MKVSFTLKVLFENYHVVLILFILGYIYQFTPIKWETLPQALQNVIVTWNSSGTLSERMTQFPPLVYRLATSLILWTCVYSGIIYMCRRIIRGESANMGDFVAGVEKNLKNVIIVLTLFAISFGLVRNFLQILTGYIPLGDGIITASVKSLFSESLSLFYNALVIYGSIFLIENRVKTSLVFHSVIKFIFSKESLKLYILMLFAAFLLLPVYILQAYYYQLSLSRGLAGGLGSFMDIVSPGKTPVWIKCLEWLINTVINAFTVMYVGTIFFNDSREPGHVDPSAQADGSDL